MTPPRATQKHRRLSRSWSALAVGGAVVVTLVAGCTSAPEPDPGPDEPAPSAYQEDQGQVTDLRQGAALDVCPDLADAAPTVPVDDPLPDLTLDCLGDGPAVNLAHLGGVPYVVNVWAGWCTPCRDEMPILQEVYEQSAGRVGMLGVDFQDTTVAGLSAAAEFGVTFPSVQDPDGETRAKLRFPGMPFTAFVAADGEIIARRSGGIASAAELRRLIAEHLGVTL